MRVSICQVPLPVCAAGAPAQRPVDSIVPPPTCAFSARTAATLSCQVTSARSWSTGNWRWSHGPAARLARSASTAQPAVPVPGSGAMSSRPLRWVRGASAQMAPRSTARRRACASGSGCAAQGVMRAVACASGMSAAVAGALALVTGAAGVGAADAAVAGADAKPASGGSAGMAGADAPGTATAACRSACAAMSVIGPRSVACSVSGTGALAPGTGAVSAPASATSTRIGACAVAAARSR